MCEMIAKPRRSKPLHPRWSGSQPALAQGVWAALGLLTTYDHTKDQVCLNGALKAYNYLIHQMGFEKTPHGKAIRYFAQHASDIVPNNTTLALTFFASLARSTFRQRMHINLAPLGSPRLSFHGFLIY